MRSSGVLMHISSLPSPYGIGTMGKEARKFVDFLDKSGQKYWQILPICPTSYGDSPYQSFSSFAGNPYFIDHPGTKLGNHYLKAHIKRTPIFFYCKTNALLFAERADIITEILVGYFCECAVLYHL